MFVIDNFYRYRITVARLNSYLVNLIIILTVIFYLSFKYFGYFFGIKFIIVIYFRGYTGTVF